MGFGAFAGGVVKGYQAVNDVINTNKRTQIAEQDQALRKQASDREESRYQREVGEQAKKDAYEKEVAENMQKIFGQPATEQSTGTMTGPLDARDARAGTMDGVKTEYNIPAQAATGDGGFQGVNLMDPSTHGKLMRLEAMNMQAKIRNGMFKPDEIKQYAEWGKKMEKDGTAQAFGRFMMGDSSALDEVAKRNGVKAYTTEFGKDENGLPSLNFKIEKEDGTVQVVPAALFAAGIGATDYVNVLDKMDDNITNRYKAQQLGDYYTGQVGAAEERNAITEADLAERRRLEGKRTDAIVGERSAMARKHDRWVPGAGRTGAGGKGEPGASYDPNLLPSMVTKTPMMLPQFGKSLPGQEHKPVKDNDGMAAAAEIGNEYHSTGMDPSRALSIGRKVVEKAGAAALQELGPKATEAEYKKRRQELIEQAREQLKKSQPKGEPKPAAAPARSSALPVISESTQKARNDERVVILRQEQQAEQQRLAELKANPKDTKEYRDAVARSEKSLEALAATMNDYSKQASAFRSR